MNKEDHLKSLISAMLDESISTEQSQELDSLLQESADAREIYRRYIDLHFTLNETVESKDELKFSIDLPQPENFPEAYRSVRHKLIFFQTIAAILAITFIVTLFNETPVNKTIQLVSAQPNKSVIATLVNISADIEWVSKAHETGDELTVQSLIISQGEITLLYKHGAEIKLEGPAHYTLESLEMAKMQYGQLAAKVPEAAQGFTIKAHKAAIVDLGTEFALNVSPQGKSQVYVYDGEVSSSLLGEDGHTLLNSSLFRHDGIEIDSKAGSLTTLKGQEEFIRVSHPVSSNLLISDDYIETIKKDAPLAYWRFQNSKNGLVKNEMSDNFHGKLTHDALITNDSFTVKKGNLGAFSVATPFTGINKKHYTIELWLKAFERGSEMSLVSLMNPQPEGKRYAHLTYTQLMSNHKRLWCRPFDFRFSHRYPATSNIGKNAFAGEAYIPGKWYHLVCVRDDASFHLYLNGKLKTSVKESSNNDEKPYLFYMGKIDPMRNIRQFIGQIDEVALYNKALSLEEIKKHYNKVSK